MLRIIAPTTITVNAIKGEGSAFFQAEFPPNDHDNENSVPICDHLFKWMATGSELRKLKFTEDFALEDFQYNTRKEELLCI